PLPAILALQDFLYVKIMHDVSEGGVKGALLELAESLKLRLNISSKNLITAKFHQAKNDILRAPSYGTLIVILDATGMEEAKKRCKQAGYTFVEAGFIEEGSGLVVDGVEVEEQKRIDLDEIYGSFKQTDEIMTRVNQAIDDLTKLEGFLDYIPEVGTNIVYSKPKPESPADVAGLSGRITRGTRKPLICGEVEYGASRYLASLLMEANKLNPTIRAAVNIRGGNDIPGKLSNLGLEAVVLPSKTKENVCPVTTYIRETGSLVNAYVHPGDFGIEATTTIIAETPEKLVSILDELIRV
ncbi:MAG: AIR synthase-related protein, partial [Candidatus Bathyarchaeota archaeon]|nr:AIR synthase-related protein [Candidatus Bathyarchaeota archaeon]